MGVRVGAEPRSGCRCRSGHPRHHPGLLPGLLCKTSPHQFTLRSWQPPVTATVQLRGWAPSSQRIQVGAPLRVRDPSGSRRLHKPPPPPPHHGPSLSPLPRSRRAGWGRASEGLERLGTAVMAGHRAAPGAAPLSPQVRGGRRHARQWVRGQGPRWAWQSGGLGPQSGRRGPR